MIPAKLKKGDIVRVITPSRSLRLPWINDELREEAERKFRDLGLKLTFSKHVDDKDEFSSSSIQARIEDLQDAFSDPQVKLIITVIGGFNSNQLLRYIDYDLIMKNPKIFCGYSDITALHNAIYAKTGLVTYSGPHYFSFGDKKGFDYTLEYFKRCLFDSKLYEVLPPSAWSDDRWASDQVNRNFYTHGGYSIINKGEAEGICIGSNLCTLNLLQGTEYMPNIRDKIIFIEDDYESQPHDFDRDLQSLIHQPGFEKVKGLIIGRFQLKSNMTKKLLAKIIRTKKELDDIPVIADVDFGHTTPQITFPIGGKVRLVAEEKIRLEMIEH